MNTKGLDSNSVGLPEWAHNPVGLDVRVYCGLAITLYIVSYTIHIALHLRHKCWCMTVQNRPKATVDHNALYAHLHDCRYAAQA